MVITFVTLYVISLKRCKKVMVSCFWFVTRCILLIVMKLSTFYVIQGFMTKIITVVAMTQKNMLISTCHLSSRNHISSVFVMRGWRIFLTLFLFNWTLKCNIIASFISTLVCEGRTFHLIFFVIS